MSENIELSYVWYHTIIKILNHDIQSKIGNMIKEWVVFNKLEDFNSLLEYTDDDFTPNGKFCYINAEKSIGVWWYAISPDNPVAHLVQKRTPH